MRGLGLLILLVFLLSGCGPISINSPSKPVEKTETVVVVNTTIYDAMIADKVTKEDAEILYKNFRGLVEYLPHSKKLDNTVKVFQLIKEFQLEYGYQKLGYSKLTDAVEKHLMDAGYKQPKRIVDTNAKENEVLRAQVVADMKVIADSVEKYLRGLK